ncbi:MAG: Cell division protein ftsZ [uncultured bacterium]|nr:MAG: Cell division protein ftsZ [uncultured bacterium]
MGMILFDTKKGVCKVRIKAYGVGGGGSNALNTMIGEGMNKITFAAVNTDIQALSRSHADEKIQIGEKLTGGLGAGANPNMGRQAAEESIDVINDSLEEADICIVIAGMGGGTGTGAAPVIAHAARQQGKMVISFVTTPFEFEGRHRGKNALLGLDELREYSHSLIVIPNDKLYSIITEDTSFVDAFRKVDMILMEAVNSLTRLILDPGMINLDFADVRAVMSIGGQAVITFGVGMGVNRAINAVDAALSNVLIEAKKLKGARGLLLNVVGGADMTLHEVTNCIQKLRANIHEDANIIFGANIDPKMNEKVMISIIATGIEESLDSSHSINSGIIHDRKITPSIAPFNKITPGNEGSSMFESNTVHPDFDDEFDVPTYIRRSRRFKNVSSYIEND